MKSPREIKTGKIDHFKAQMNESKAVIIADYKGLTVHEMEDLRMKLREAGGQISVIKNTLARLALDDMGVEKLGDDLTGQMAFVFSQADAVGGTKVAHDFAKGNDSFKIVAGYFDGRRISMDEVISLANLPSRKDLEARLVLTILAPMQGIVGILAAPIQEFIGTLEARASKLEQGGETSAA